MLKMIDLLSGIYNRSTGLERVESLVFTCPAQLMEDLSESASLKVFAVKRHFNV